MWVRTSNAFYGIFILDMDRSPGFGPAYTDSNRPVKTWFPCGSGISSLNLASTHSSPDRSTKSTRSRSYGASTVYKHRVSGSLSLPSRGSFHLSFTVLCSIGHWGVFRLTRWSPLLPSRFHVSRCTLDTALPSPPSHTGLSPSLAGFPKAVLLDSTVSCAVRTPECTHPGLASSAFARRYLRNRCFFLFLRLLRCFSSPGSPPWPIDSAMDTWSLSMWVPPFRYPGIFGYLLLPTAFRSLSRLSSALSAKASTLRSFQLNLFAA